MLPEAIEVAQPFDLRLRGKAYWLEEADEWITPFFFSARLAEDADVLSEYLIQFGDAGRDLARDKWGKRLKDINWFYPEKWIFTFRKP